MSRPNILDFERLIRAYLADQASWEEVHQLALNLEWSGGVHFPEQIRQPLEALHTAFLTADEKDDPQFRIDKAEVARLLQDIDDREGGRRM